MTEDIPMAKKRCAVFTMVKNESFNLPIWLRYYKQQFAPEDIYILDHQSNDGSTTNTGVNVIRVENEEIFDHDWLKKVVTDFHRYLLQLYDYVLFAEADEIVVPSPEHFQNLAHYVAVVTEPIICPLGYDIFRKTKMYANILYNKPILTSVPVSWNYGYHTCAEGGSVDTKLYLFHLHKLDYDQAWQKNLRWATMKWNDRAKRDGLSIQNQHTIKEKFDAWYNDTMDMEPIDIPQWIIEAKLW